MKKINLHKILLLFIGTLLISCSSDDTDNVDKPIDQERFEVISQYQLFKENGIEPRITTGNENELNYQLYIDRKFWKDQVTVKLKSLPNGVSLNYEGQDIAQGDTFIHDFTVETDGDEDTFDSTMVLTILASESGNETIVYEFTTPLGKTHLLEENIVIH